MGLSRAAGHPSIPRRWRRRSWRSRRRWEDGTSTNPS